MILIILGWIASFPILKFSVQARSEKALTNNTFLVYYVIIGVISVLYYALRYNIASVEFNDKERMCFLTKENNLGFLKRVTLNYDGITFSDYQMKMYAGIELFEYGKRMTYLYKRDFSNEVYLVIKKKLKSIALIK